MKGVEDKALTITQAASFLGVSRSFIYRLIQTDKAFPKGAIIGARRRFLASDLHQYMAKKSQAKR